VLRRGDVSAAHANMPPDAKGICVVHGLRIRGFTIRWEAIAFLALLAAALGVCVTSIATTSAWRLAGNCALGCAVVLGGLAVRTALTAVRVFLTHSVNAEQEVLLLRLKDLASGHGVEVEISGRGRFGDRGGTLGLSRRTRSAINRSEVVLAIITTTIDLVTESELDYARSKGKLIVPIIGPHVETRAVSGKFGKMIRSFPEQSEDGVQAAEFLQGTNSSKRVQEGVRTVIGIGVELLKGR
jgi:hypothetical protein